MKKLAKTLLILTSTLSLTAMAAAKPAQQTAPAFSPTQVTQIQQIIHDYLVKNPSVLVEASRVLQTQQQEKLQSDAMAGIKASKADLFDNAKSPTLGSKMATVTLVEFFDYQCGHCKQMESTVAKIVSDNKNVRVIFKELPIFGGVSEYSAKVALAAAMQSTEKYYAFHNALLSTTTPLTKDSIMNTATSVGLNVAKLKTDMDSPEVQKQLHDNFQLAQTLKIMGTPTFVITNKEQTKFGYIPGATSLADLEAQLKKVQ